MPELDTLIALAASARKDADAASAAVREANAIHSETLERVERANEDLRKEIERRIKEQARPNL